MNDEALGAFGFTRNVLTALLMDLLERRLIDDEHILRLLNNLDTLNEKFLVEGEAKAQATIEVSRLHAALLQSKHP